MTSRHILGGIGVAGLATALVVGGWTVGASQASGTPQVQDAAQTTDSSDATDSPDQPAASSDSTTQVTSQNTGNSEQTQPKAKPTAARPESAKKVPAAQLLPFAPGAGAPNWTVAFGQGNDKGGAANSGPVQRHLTWAQIDLLDEIALALPDSARDWLTVECTTDRESASFAGEIHDVFLASQRVKVLNARLAEPEPNLRGVFVTVSSQKDEHFGFAQLIAAALNSPDRPVHFGPSADAKPGIVKITVLPAESAQLIAQVRK